MATNGELDEPLKKGNNGHGDKSQQCMLTVTLMLAP